ncbi:MAG: hypothetical protein IKE47_06685, partial [Oscillospiraceae bacterium]|nr:hypothetical protein [Oscillospiraceae bacterium]
MWRLDPDCYRRAVDELRQLFPVVEGFLPCQEYIRIGAAGGCFAAAVDGGFPQPHEDHDRWPGEVRETIISRRRDPEASGACLASAGLQRLNH